MLLRRLIHRFYNELKTTINIQYYLVFVRIHFYRVFYFSLYDLYIFFIFLSRIFGLVKLYFESDTHVNNRTYFIFLEQEPGESSARRN